jgi:hypothetical protein
MDEQFVVTEAPENKMSLSIPKALYDALVKASRGRGFSSVDEFAEYLLRVSVGKEVPEGPPGSDKSVLEQLRKLGYT